MKRAPLVALWLLGACWAQPVRDVAPAKTAVVATARHVQGGLVDVRYGQVSINTGGEATVLELAADSVVTLDGVSLTSEQLLKAIPNSLSAVATYRAGSGVIEKLEAYTAGAKQGRVALTLSPRRSPAYRDGELVTVLLSSAESARLGLKDPTLSAPGIGPSRFVPAQRGGFKAHLRLRSDTNLVDLPLLLQSGQTVYRGPSVSLSATAPLIQGFGPERASAQMTNFPGWVDLSHPPSLLDLSSAKLQTSPGLQVLSFVPRVDRSLFELRADGPGWYWLEFEVRDELGRTSRKRWNLEVRP